MTCVLLNLKENQSYPEIVPFKIKDDQLAKMVSKLTDVALEFSHHQSLRIRLGDVVKEYLR